MERVAVLCRGNIITASDLAFLSTTAGARDRDGQPDWTEGDLPGAVARLEMHMIRRALEEAGGNRTEAAKRLGIHRQLLYAKAEKYGIAVGELSADRTGFVAKADDGDRQKFDNPK